jgi:hypothetical protein
VLKRERLHRQDQRTNYSRQSESMKSHRVLHCSTGRPGTTAHKRQTTGSATKMMRSTAKKQTRPETKPTPQTNPTPHNTQETSNHLRHTAHVMACIAAPALGANTGQGYPCSRAKQRRPQLGSAADMHSGLPSAVHISGRMMRPLEPAGSSMGSLKTSGRRACGRCGGTVQQPGD